ncbi:uncharacterized protein LOC132751167 isoform X2 [Ruditapes philippinarum]|uniref:uncharacterized protein LOC132751167 isoform X1 n=1 Tax=Ruditapes philippinarum TaxID=129788 RepID=UPI00295B0AAD|nr:uncharacterized protein LOC132751167 isoform X1 [Ruditapes philippinarum]XP_060597286.1 uncharacterized protein LOC132751167 isoform X2 [Ruditapes philippinarum]
MNIISIVFSMLACVYSVTMYPLDNLPLYQEEMLETDYPEVLYDPEVILPYTSYPSPVIVYPELSLSKRQDTRNVNVNKRATLNQLLRRLIALYGNNDIAFSGRSSHVRFGAGGR